MKNLNQKIPSIPKIYQSKWQGLLSHRGQYNLELTFELLKILKIGPSFFANKISKSENFNQIFFYIS